MQHKKIISHKKSSLSGFTMIEMLTVIAIFGIVSAVVLFNHGRFTNETILTNTAYEMALSIREAQVYGLSVRQGDGDNFDKSYGIYIPSFSTGSQIKDYLLFIDSNNNKKFDGTDCNYTECVIPYTIRRHIFIDQTDVEVDNSCPANHQNDGLHIVFNRPDPEPIISTDSGIIDNATRAQITIKTRDGATRYVVVSNNGQIAVHNQSICQQP